MATAAAIATLNRNIEPDTLGRHCTYYGTIAVDAAADTYATNGLTVSFAIAGIPHADAPVWCEIVSGGAADGFVYQYVPGTNAADGKMVIFTSNTVVAGQAAPLVQMDNGFAIPAGVSGTDQKFKVTFIHGR